MGELNGKYYCFYCMDADLDGLHPAEEFNSQREAVRLAADHEADLYLQEYRNGIQTDSKQLYDPFGCF